MAYSVTGSPLGPFADAVLTALLDDGNLVALVGQNVLATLPRGSATPFPYIVGSRRDLVKGSVAMQQEGGQARLWLDFWSDKNDPGEVQFLMGRAKATLSRRTLAVVGFSMYGGSLECVDELVLPDFDPDMPQRTLYHGVQQWVADLEELG